LAALVYTTYSGIQQKARDTKRQTDIQAQYSELEAYYATAAGYPVLSDFNSAAWRTANMKGLDPNAFCDPTASSQTNCVDVSSPQANAYSYQVWQSDGTTACTASAGQTCPKYTLTATLEGTINGSGTYVKNSLN